MGDIDGILEGEGIDKEKLEAALEIGRLAANDIGICCEDLGKLCWYCYQMLEEEEADQ